MKEQLFLIDFFNTVVKEKYPNAYKLKRKYYPKKGTDWCDSGYGYNGVFDCHYNIVDEKGEVLCENIYDLIDYEETLPPYPLDLDFCFNFGNEAEDYQPFVKAIENNTPLCFTDFLAFIINISCCTMEYNYKTEWLRTENHKGMKAKLFLNENTFIIKWWNEEYKIDIKKDMKTFFKAMYFLFSDDCYDMRKKEVLKNIFK